jgi:hypothetical protein
LSIDTETGEMTLRASPWAIEEARCRSECRGCGVKIAAELRLGLGDRFQDSALRTIVIWRGEPRKNDLQRKTM